MTVNVKTNNNTKALIEPYNISNPNLLINPDFKINQRGQDTYSKSSGSMYSVDRWKIWMCSFSHGHILGHAQFKHDVRFGVNVLDVELMEQRQISGISIQLQLLITLQ